MPSTRTPRDNDLYNIIHDALLPLYIIVPTYIHYYCNICLGVSCPRFRLFRTASAFFTPAGFSPFELSQDSMTYKTMQILNDDKKKISAKIRLGSYIDRTAPPLISTWRGAFTPSSCPRKLISERWKTPIAMSVITLFLIPLIILLSQGRRDTYT